MDANIESLIAQRFIVRKDVKAVQHADGSYAPDRTPITRQDLQAHVAGTRTLGYYHLGSDSTCKTMCFDLDWMSPKPKLDPPVAFHWEDEVGISREYNPREVWLDREHPHRQDMIVKMRCLSEYLALTISRLFGLGTAILQSGGKGVHVYGFFDGPTSAATVRECAHEVLNLGKHFEMVKGQNFWQPVGHGYSGIEVEVFPKQDSLDGKDLGNLLRMPLGIHQRTKRKSFFVDCLKGYAIMAPGDPVQAMTELNPWHSTVKVADEMVPTVLDGAQYAPNVAP